MSELDNVELKSFAYESGLGFPAEQQVKLVLRRKDDGALKDASIRLSYEAAQVINHLIMGSISQEWESVVREATKYQVK